MNDLSIRFKVVPPEGDPIYTTSRVDANYQASQLGCHSYFEELYRDPEKPLKSTECKTEPTDEPSPEELQRRDDKAAIEAAQKTAAEAPPEEEPAGTEKEPVFGLRVPAGTSRFPHNFRESNKRDPETEEGETLPPPQQFGRVVSPTRSK